MNLMHEHLQQMTRRHFLRDSQLGLGALALAGLGGGSSAAAPTGFVNPLAAKAPHFAPTAKRVIYLHMAGSPRTWICSTTSRNW